MKSTLKVNKLIMKKAMFEKGYFTDDQLAAELDVDRKSVHRWRNGGAISPGYASVLSRTLELPSSYLFTIENT